MTAMIQRTLGVSARVVLADETARPGAGRDSLDKPPLRTASGASAELDERGRTFLLRDTQGQLVCEFDSVAGRLVVHARGELEVKTPEAALSFKADRIGFEAEEVTLRSSSFSAECERASWKAERWELRAMRIAERALDKLLDVEASVQVRAGRVRSLVGETWELLSRRTRMVSKENTSIDGEKILLG